MRLQPRVCGIPSGKSWRQAAWSPARFSNSITRGFRGCWATRRGGGACFPRTEVAFEREVESEPTFGFPRSAKLRESVARFRQVDLDRPAARPITALEFPQRPYREGQPAVRRAAPRLCCSFRPTKTAQHEHPTRRSTRLSPPHGVGTSLSFPDGIIVIGWGRFARSQTMNVDAWGWLMLKPLCMSWLGPMAEEGGAIGLRGRGSAGLPSWQPQNRGADPRGGLRLISEEARPASPCRCCPLGRV